MAVEIWPPITPAELTKAEVEAQAREVKWLVDELHDTLQTIRHGLEDCYALLAPIDPGAALPITTPGKEFVKGVVTRVGTRIVRGQIHLRLRTLPQQTLTINQNHPIHISPLINLTNILNQAIDMLTLTLDVPVNAHFLHAQLRLLAGLLSEADALLRGQPVAPPSRDWTTGSLSAGHFNPPLGASVVSGSSIGSSLSSSSSASKSSIFPHDPAAPGGCPPLSVNIALRNGNIVFAFRSLELVDSHVGFGMKLALAIGTTRRLEHDEADRVFSFTVPGIPEGPGGRPASSHSFNPPSGSRVPGAGKAESWKGLGARTGSVSSLGGGEKRREVEVYVREKIEVETGDPALLSVGIKLRALAKTLAQARRNLADLLGEELEDD